MTDKNIAELAELAAVTDDTLIPVWQPGAADEAQSMTGKQFREFAEAAGEAAVKPHSNSEVKPYALAAKSYAVGGTGTREGENTANARYYMEQARQAAGVIPSLTEEQKTTLRDLMLAYASRAANFVYDNDVSRNAFAPGNNPYNADGKIRINCAMLPQLVWAGVHPDSYVGKQATYNGTFTKFNDMDWGFQFDYPLRRAYGVTSANGGLIGYVEAGENSYSANTYYSKDSTAGGKQGQHFKNYIYGSDMAQEACIKGFEIPLGCADVGDIIFYRAPSFHDGFQDGAQNKAFRNIGHVGMVYGVDYKEDGGRAGSLIIMESTDFYATAIVRNSINYSGAADVVRAADLADRACMCIRHPAAFGIPTNVDDHFNLLYRGMNQPG